MPQTPIDSLRDGRLLSLAIKDVRNHLRLSAREVAGRMNMGLRAYQHFEAGRNKPNLEYIHRFCEVTKSDLFALLGALMIGSPQFAWRTAENKLMTILMVGLGDYNETHLHHRRRGHVRATETRRRRTRRGSQALVGAGGANPENETSQAGALNIRRI
jgi:transcriptional regulator with XRE-family HTH domain